MHKRCRFWVFAACGLALAAVPLLAYRLWWYPHTQRGAVDRIRMGMTAAEVRAILEPLEDGGKGWNTKYVCAERWILKDGEVVHERSEGLMAALEHFKVHWRHTASGFRGRGGSFLDKVTRDGIISVKLDERSRVCGKVWLEFPRESSNPLEQFWSWLPL
jgi:hypothetical protein